MSHASGGRRSSADTFSVDPRIRYHQSGHLLIRSRLTDNTQSLPSLKTTHASTQNEVMDVPTSSRCGFDLKGEKACWVSSFCVRLRLLFLCIAMSVTITRVFFPVIRKNIAKRYTHRSERYSVVAGISRTSMLWLECSY